MNEENEIMESVLVVDDEEDFLNLMLLHLSKKGYQVTGATDPEEALKILEGQAGKFSVLVTDWMMPKMSGNSLIGSARQIDPVIEAIIITSVNAMGSVSKMGFGAFEYLDKPLKSMSVLSDTVKRAIAYREKRIQRINAHKNMVTSEEKSDQETTN